MELSETNIIGGLGRMVDPKHPLGIALTRHIREVARLVVDANLQIYSNEFPGRGVADPEMLSGWVQ